MTFILLAIAVIGMHRLRALDRQVEHRATWHICPVCQRDVSERVVAMHAKTHDAAPTWCSARTAR